MWRASGPSSDGARAIPPAGHRRVPAPGQCGELDTFGSHDRNHWPPGLRLTSGIISPLVAKKSRACHGIQEQAGAEQHTAITAPQFCTISFRLWRGVLDAGTGKRWHRCLKLRDSHGGKAMARQKGSRTGRCQGCNHPERVRIERLLAAGASIKGTARKFEIEYHALRRHWINHVSAEARTAYIAGTGAAIGAASEVGDGNWRLSPRGREHEDWRREHEDWR